jgi:hypothetical protein
MQLPSPINLTRAILWYKSEKVRNAFAGKQENRESDVELK